MKNARILEGLEFIKQVGQNFNCFPRKLTSPLSLLLGLSIVTSHFPSPQHLIPKTTEELLEILICGIPTNVHRPDLAMSQYFCLLFPLYKPDCRLFINGFLQLITSD